MNDHSIVCYQAIPDKLSTIEMTIYSPLQEGYLQISSIEHFYGIKDITRQDQGGYLQYSL